MRMKNHFHINDYALSLALIQRLGTTRKWLVLAITKLLRKLGPNLPPKTVLQCTSTQHLQSWGTQIKDEAVQKPKRAIFPS